MQRRRWFHLGGFLGTGLFLFFLLVGSQAHSGPLAIGKGLPVTRRTEAEERPPTSFAEWQARQPAAAPLRVEQVYASPHDPTRAASDRVVCVLVQPSLYDDIAAALTGWATAVESEGWRAIVYSASFPDPPSLRAHIASMADLQGCLLIGDLPVPWYEMNDKQFPMDQYYMDLDGTWHDGDGNGLYDDHTGDVEPEIWVGRLTADNLTFGENEAALVNNYFRKNLAYRSGDLVLPARALVYVDDDWAFRADRYRRNTELIYPDTTLISDTNTTRAADYAQRLVDDYAFIYLFAHTSPSTHYFTHDEGGTRVRTALPNTRIYEIDPHAFFYHFFACSAARFVEPDYIAGWYVFADRYGLMALSSTRSGGMWNGTDWFYEQLGQGEAWGDAFKEWFKVYGIVDVAHHYGLTLVGDPTLAMKKLYGVRWSPSVAALSGDPGETVAYTLHLTHTGNTVDSFAVTVEEAAWPISAPGTTGPIYAGGEAEIGIGVSIPAGAAGKARDVAVVSVTSQGDRSQTATAVLTTTANSVYRVQIVPAVSTQSAAPGTTVTYTVSITNQANVTDSFALSVAGHTWPTVAPAMLGPLGRDEGTSVNVQVTVPPDATAGDADSALLGVTSRGDSDAQRTVVLTTRAANDKPPRNDLYLPFIVRQG